FMRDTLVNIPDVGSSDTPDSKINSAFTIGEQYNKQGVNLMSETLKNNFGINCQYYAVVDFSSFATIIDSLFPTGLKIDAKFSTVNGENLSAVP
ncbi:LCP family protein, partial [Photobacterium damselae]